MYRIVALSIARLLPVLKSIYPQLFRAGVVAVPSPLLSPPASTLSSSIEVSTAFVPIPAPSPRPSGSPMVKLPVIYKYVLAANLTTAPSLMAKVIPAFTVTLDGIYQTLSVPIGSGVRVISSNNVPVNRMNFLVTLGSE